MKLEANKDVYALPPIGRILSIVTEGPSRMMQSRVLVVTEESLHDLRRKHTEEQQGLPRYAVHLQVGGKHMLWVYPTPDVDGVLHVQYYPPMMKV